MAKTKAQLEAELKTVYRKLESITNNLNQAIANVNGVVEYGIDPDSCSDIWNQGVCYLDADYETRQNRTNFQAGYCSASMNSTVQRLASLQLEVHGYLND